MTKKGWIVVCITSNPDLIETASQHPLNQTRGFLYCTLSLQIDKRTFVCAFSELFLRQY